MKPIAMLVTPKPPQARHAVLLDADRTFGMPDGSVAEPLYAAADVLALHRRTATAQAELAALRHALYAVYTAIDNAGPNPRFHRQVLARHRDEWPTLWRALDRLREVAPCG